MELDPVLLSRAQFATVITFHILFPAISIGLAWILLFFRIRFTRTGDRDWEFAYYFWVKIFALSFAIGIVTGVVMSFQFGTNWPGFMERAGNVAGPLLGYEVLTAFFLEASFLGIMLFGKNLVSNRTHLIASSMVALGTTLSGFWILSLSSWMQTPRGYSIDENGVFQVESWLEIIFNPTLPYRFTHMIIACLLTGAFLIMGISARRMRRQVDGPATLRVFRTGLVMAMVLAPVQAVVGDLHGLHTLEHQPAKIAAIEAVWETGTNVPFTLFGFPDEEGRNTAFPIEIPGLTSYILTHDFAGEVQGLNDFEDHPPVAVVFWSFRIMVATGIVMILTAWWGAWHVLWKKRAPGPHMQRVFSWMTFSGWVGLVAGWWVTEVGRQPWMVQGLLRVEDLAADHPGGTVLGTLVAYILLYFFIGAAFLFTVRYMSTKPAASLIASRLNYPQDPGGDK